MSESTNVKPARILIVEDEAAIRTLISFACAAAGYEVECAEDAQKAQNVVDNNPPDLVLLDYMLPGLSGVEWLERLPAAVNPTASKGLTPAPMTTSSNRLCPVS